VEIMNDRRRHENMETMRLRAEKRRQRVVAARQRGRSTRAIARAEDVSERTIRNDLATATAEGTQLPPTITGLDGKVRPAQKHRLIPELAEREYSPKVLPLLEALPRGTQLDIARLVTGGVHIRDAIRQVQHQREPGDDSAQIEADNAAQKAKPKNGTALFDWRRFHADWGALLRQVDALGNAYRCKESPAAEELRNELAQWKERFKGLYRSVAQQEAPKE
jgi:transposase